jgi:hypothetical protein
MDRASLIRKLTRPFAALSLGLLLLTTSCVYDNHACMGMTEKWTHSDVNYVTKIIGTPIIAIVDSIIAPFTGLCDELDPPSYVPDHEYLSYVGSRVIGRSTMGDGYKWISSVPSIVIETVWFPLTGLVDLFTVLFDDTGRQDDDDVAAAPAEVVEYQVQPTY